MASLLETLRNIFSGGGMTGGTSDTPVEPVAEEPVVSEPVAEEPVAEAPSLGEETPAAPEAPVEETPMSE